jgi:hypothetical protein
MTMSQSYYIRLTGVLFLVFAAAHLLRFVLRVDVLVGSRPVPLGLSLVPVVVGGYLAYCAFRLAKGT